MMNIKHHLLIGGLVLGSLITNAQNLKHNQFILSGTIKGNTSGRVYFRFANEKEKFQLDSCKLTDGKFSFSGFIKGPTLALITTGKRPLVNDEDMEADGKNSTLVFLEPALMTADLEEPHFKDGHVSGSATQNQFADYNHKMDAIAQAFKTSADSALAATGNNRDKAQAPLQQLSHRCDALKAALTRNFLQQNPASYVTAYLVSESHFKLDTLKMYYSKMPAVVRKSIYGDDLGEKIEKKELVTAGHHAPGFTQKAADGTPVSLNSFKGKYVLLVFWSTSNNASRTLNKSLVDTYNQLKDKNFTIIGISIDGEKTRKIWQATLDKDKLPWLQLAALKTNHNPAATAYYVEDAPASFLINPSGTIIAADLSPDAWNAKLKTTVK